jgi:hypothetical protein
MTPQHRGFSPGSMISRPVRADLRISLIGDLEIQSGLIATSPRGWVSPPMREIGLWCMRTRRHAKEMYILLNKVMFLLLSALAAAQLQMPVTCKGPLNEQQLTRLLTSGIADPRIQAFVQQCGVDFDTTEEVEKHLKQGGASDALLRLVHQRSPKARNTALLQETIRHAINSGTWVDAKTKLAQLRGLVPDDDEMRSWDTLIEEHDRVEQQKQRESVEQQQSEEIRSEEQKHREELRIVELRRKLAIDAKPLPNLALAMSLDEARVQLRSLRAQRRNIESRLRTEYPDLQSPPIMKKDTFETTAEYEGRIVKAQDAHKAMEASYAKDLRELTSEYDSQVADLLSRQYIQTTWKVSLKSYDADYARLLATLQAAVGKCSYIFSVRPLIARALYTHEAALRIKGNFLEIEEKHGVCATIVSLLDSSIEEDMRGVAPAPYPFGFTSAHLTLNGHARIVGNRLRLTDASSTDEAASAFLDERVNVQAFTLQFGFQLRNASADGFTIVFQNMGPAALGPNGGGLGYGADKYRGSLGVEPIHSSVAVKFQFIAGREATTGLLRDGESPGNVNVSFQPSGINICNGDLYTADVDYNGKKLSLTLSDRAKPSSRFSTSWEVDIPSIVGSTTAYVGFTAGTGSLTSTQEITDWLYFSPFN